MIAGKLSFIPKHSHFIPTQEIKIQETPDQLREGNIPRNLKLVLAETNVKKALPGDIV
jgi:DNA replicative helicase MCM subunit Mcm2 (Cdc46/Mcm family)